MNNLRDRPYLRVAYFNHSLETTQSAELVQGAKLSQGVVEDSSSGRLHYRFCSGGALSRRPLPPSTCLTLRFSHRLAHSGLPAPLGLALTRF
jgi:hypothetical protein